MAQVPIPHEGFAYAFRVRCRQVLEALQVFQLSYILRCGIVQEPLSCLAGTSTHPWTGQNRLCKSLLMWCRPIRVKRHARSEIVQLKDLFQVFLIISWISRRIQNYSKTQFVEAIQVLPISETAVQLEAKLRSQLFQRQKGLLSLTKYFYIFKSRFFSKIDLNPWLEAGVASFLHL